MHWGRRIIHQAVERTGQGRCRFLVRHMSESISHLIHLPVTQMPAWVPGQLAKEEHLSHRTINCLSKIEFSLSLSPSLFLPPPSPSSASPTCKRSLFFSPLSLQPSSFFPRASSLFTASHFLSLSLSLSASTLSLLLTEEEAQTSKYLSICYKKGTGGRENAFTQSTSLSLSLSLSSCISIPCSCEMLVCIIDDSNLTSLPVTDAG